MGRKNPDELVAHTHIMRSWREIRLYCNSSATKIVIPSWPELYSIVRVDSGRQRKSCEG